MKLCELVRSYRQEHHLSQRQFADICGMSNAYISFLESQTNPQTGCPITPKLPTLKKLAAGMGISLETLLSTAEDMPVGLFPPEKDEAAAEEASAAARLSRKIPNWPDLTEENKARLLDYAALLLKSQQDE